MKNKRMSIYAVQVPLTKVNLFKNNNLPSWSFDTENNITIKKLSTATSWPAWFSALVMCSRAGNGFKIQTYKRSHCGIVKKIIPNKYPKRPILNPDLIADKSKPAWIQKTL